MSVTYKQMEKNLQMCQSQLEAGKLQYKKMQADLQKELQQAFNENTRLTSLMDGKVPKDFLSSVELEGRVRELEKELDKALEDNMALKQEVNTLSEVDTAMKLDELPCQNEQLEMKLSCCLARIEEEKTKCSQLEKELQEKRIQFKVQEKELHELFAIIQEKDKKYEKAVEDLSELKAAAQAIEENDQLKKSVQIIETEDKCVMTLDSEDANKFDNTEGEEMKEQLSQLQQQLSSLNRSKEELQQLMESLQTEKKQLQCDLQENIDVLVESQEELRILKDQLMLKQQREEELCKLLEVNEQKLCKLEESSQVSTSDYESLLLEKEQLLKSLGRVSSELKLVNEELNGNMSSLERLEMEKREASERLHQLQEELTSLREEREQLLQVLQGTRTERDELKNDLQENIELLTKAQEELRSDREAEKQQLKEISLLKAEIVQLETKIAEKEAEILMNQEKLAKTKDAESQAERLSCVTEELQEKMAECRRLVLEIEQQSQSYDDLKRQHEQVVKVLRSSVSQVEAEKQEVTRRVHQLQEELTHLGEEKEKHLRVVEGIWTEREKLINDLQDNSERNKIEQSDLKNSLEVAQYKVEELEKLLSQEKLKESSLQGQIISKNHLLQQKDEELTEQHRRNQELLEQIALLKEEMASTAVVGTGRVNTESNKSVDLYQILEKKEEQLQENLKRFLEIVSNHESVLNAHESTLHKEMEAKEELVANLFPLPSAQAVQIKELQTENKKLSVKLQTSLEKKKMLLCSSPQKLERHLKCGVQLEKALATEEKKQDELLFQIQCLQQHGSKWAEAASAELRTIEFNHISAFLEKMDYKIKSCLEVQAEMEESFAIFETELTEQIKFLEDFKASLLTTCFGSRPNSVEATITNLQNENERLGQQVQFNNQKFRVLFNRMIELLKGNHLDEIEGQVRAQQQRNEELLRQFQQLMKALEASDSSSGSSEGKHRAEEIEKMQVRIRELELALDTEKADRKEMVKTLQTQLVSKSTFSQELHNKLMTKEEQFSSLEKHLESLQAKINEGAEPYKEEIDVLKMQVVKLDMEKNKLSKIFEQESASLRANLEHKDDALRTLKEELRRLQQAKDTTIMVEDDEQQLVSQLPATCGGGSGIVQSTAILVLKSEKWKLEKEVQLLKKKNEQLSLKALKWKDRIQKLEESRDSCSALSAENSQGHPLVSPRKLHLQDSSLLSPKKSCVQHDHLVKSPKKVQVQQEQVSSHTRLFSQDTLYLDSCKSNFFDMQSKSIPVVSSTKFFDNSSLGTLPDMSPQKKVPGQDEEHGLRTELERRGNAPECKMQ
nr:PREDICTED: centromere-associated protein E [Latimeria chalumnae]|eukprot:XP_014350547.1 PREDICTED: centromere-associated protein E [Latimeria chalumnae]